MPGGEKMMGLRKMTLIAFVGATLLSCSAESPKRIPLNPVEKEIISEVAPLSKDSFRPALDVLFVIDDSGSMDPHQQNLRANISKFADAIVRIKYLDYHVGVISSSTNSSYYNPNSCCGMLEGAVRYVDRLTPDGINVLARNLVVGTSGDGREMFFDPVYMALTEPNLSGYNTGFYRDYATLAVIFVTDSEDQSTQQNAASLHNFLLSLKKNPEKLIVASAYISDQNLATCPSQEDTEIGELDGLESLFDLTNAITFSLCDNFGEKFADLGEKIVAKSQTMYLKQTPVTGTIKILLDGLELPSDAKFGWTYNASNNSIEFGSGIDWDSYSVGVFPQVEFEILQQKPEGQ
jgi:hypothetical protein